MGGGRRLDWQSWVVVIWRGFKNEICHAYKLVRRIYLFAEVETLCFEVG